MSRHRPLAPAVVALVLVLQGGGCAPGSADPLRERVLGELRAYLAWLERGGVEGVVGEVGWPAGPDGPRWDSLAAAWYAAAAEGGLEVTYWATGEWWGRTYPLSAYLAEDGGPLAEPAPQAAVLERQPPALRGIVVAGGEFGRVPETEPVSAFSNRAAGVYGRDWHYDRQASFDYLAARGLRVVKLPFRWERLQPRLGAPLDEAELRRLRAAVRRAGRAGLEVVLEPHNFGGYYEDAAGRGERRTLGSAALPDALFADLWARVSAAFRDEPAVRAYALMCEPADLPGPNPALAWERASQAAVDAIRAAGDDTLLHVGGYDWSSLAHWGATHPRPWIADPLGRSRYDAHHYWDADGTGEYDPPAYPGGT